MNHIEEVDYPHRPTGRASSLGGRATQLRRKPPLPPLAKKGGEDDGTVCLTCTPALSAYMGIIDAGLGRKGGALREGRRACQLFPISKDGFRGPCFAGILAQIYAWTDEKDLAIEQIAAAVQHIANTLSYGHLKLSPIWDSLRGDPGTRKSSPRSTKDRLPRISELLCRAQVTQRLLFLK